MTCPHADVTIRANYWCASHCEGRDTNQLTLTTNHGRPLRPLVEAALNNELRMLEAAIQRTEKKIRGYETAYGMSSAQFVERYENFELPETLEFAEWIGEYRLLSRLRDKADAYRGIKFAH